MSDTNKQLTNTNLNQELQLVPIDFDHFIKNNLNKVTNHLNCYYHYPAFQAFDSCLSLNENGELLVSTSRPVNPIGLKYDLNIWYHHLPYRKWAWLILYQYKKWLKRQWKKQRQYTINDCNKYLIKADEYGTFNTALFTQHAYIDWIVVHITEPIKVNEEFICRDLTYFINSLLTNVNYNIIINNRNAIRTIKSIIDYSQSINDISQSPAFLKLANILNDIN